MTALPAQMSYRRLHAVDQAKSGVASVDLREPLEAPDDCERIYAQSASGNRSSQRTAPLDSRSSRMHSSARNDWWRLAAFRRYPSLVPQAETNAARSSFAKELRYLSNLSMGIIYPQVKSKSIPIGHLPTSKLLIECRMDKFEIRRLNLLALLRTHCGGKAATLADKIGRSASYVSRMLYVDGKVGKKRIGEDMRDVIEDALALPKGQLDNEVLAVSERDGVAPPQAEAQAEASIAPLSKEEALRLLPGATPVRVVDSDDPALTHIPKVRLRLSAGISGFQVEPERFDGSTTTVPTDWIERNGYHREHLIAIRVKGESMEPTLYEDDLVVVNLADTRPADGNVYAINYEGEPLVKRLTRDAGQWWLTSDHTDQRQFYRRVCQGCDCIIVGRVVRKESERL
jgi:phage repressor protein C with HTH and peptisase S24 domain